ncbi:hypothetical protein KGN64_003197 [Salmonella enterica]|nr:hypothetical protein [Salmonella enterica]EHM5264014.1 hypothetical protein [Salmonella enterica]
MKSLDKEMLKTTAYFCADFAEKYIKGATSEDLKSFVLQFSLKMHPLCIYHAATRTHEQYGELMSVLIKYLSCEDDEGAAGYDRYSERTKLGSLNHALKTQIQRTADSVSDLFSEQIEAILKSA